jgi:hypothetical protein
MSFQDPQPIAEEADIRRSEAMRIKCLPAGFLTRERP